MEKVLLKCKIMDCANGGISWGETVEVEIEAAEDAEWTDVANLVNLATYEELTGEKLAAEDMHAIGEVRQAAGSRDHGICWVVTESQGGTDTVIEWHRGHG